MSFEEFDDIRPYNDEETSAALKRIAGNPFFFVISKYLFPRRSALALGHKLRHISSVDEFQNDVMVDVVRSIIDKSSEGFSFSGEENIKGRDGRFLAISNHRDIVLDPAFLEYSLHMAGEPYSRICVGNNLLSRPLVIDIMRSNRMITVNRGLSARELYESSFRLSKYIRTSVASGVPVWIAQREGRTKDGNDRTMQGVLKMLYMGGKGTFAENFGELGLVPMTYSYEYEPCDILKARETYLRTVKGSYTKKKREDLCSILTGIKQQKGRIHLSIGKPISAEELSAAAAESGNDRYQAICRLIDSRVNAGRVLYKTNYIAADMLAGTKENLGKEYTGADYDAFGRYVESRMRKVEKNIRGEELRGIFLRIYANPVLSI